VGPSPAFPFRWPDADAPGLSWRRQVRPTPLRPLAEDVALAFRRGGADAALLKGDDTVERTVVLNGHAYTARVPSPQSEPERRLSKEAFQRTAEALHARGETYLQVVAFPELDAANARLGAVDPATLEPAALADHLEETLRWFQRAWTLHWLWGPDGPRERFTRLYAEVTGDQRPESASELLLHEPNLFTDAVDGLIELARLAQRHAPLRRLLVSGSPAQALDALRRRPAPAGGAAFGAALDRLLDRQGLRCGAGFGVEHEEMLPGWREDPALVLALVRRYVEQDLDALLAARAAAVAARDRRAAEVRAGLPDDERRRRFDFWLAAARRAQQGFEDHNYKIDSAATSLLHLAITGCAGRLAAAGCLGAPAEIWLLHAHEVTLALRGLAPPDGDAADRDDPSSPPHWRRLVAAREALLHWQGSLTPPERVGAPPETPPAPAAEVRPDGRPAAPREAPPGALLTGQTGSAGVATGRVRLVGPEALVPDVEPGDVLVAHNAGPLWAAVFPAVAAVVLDEGVFFQHAMLTCREYGVPAVFQTKDATRRLREGQRVTVDATRGWVLPADLTG
jgi:pyruvate,water dikinase